MAKFTAGVPLNIEWANHQFIGTPSTTYRVTDALVEEFTAEVVPVIPGFAWVSQDELTSIVTLPILETNVTGLTADLASKYDKTGGTISGAVTVTGTLIAQGNATAAGNLIVQTNETVAGAFVAQGSATVANALTVGGATNLSSTLGVTGGATLLGAVNASSTLGVTSKLTLGSSIAMGAATFPGSPANNDLFYRTDLDQLFFYASGPAIWLSVDLYELPLPGSGNLSATESDVSRVRAPYLRGGTDIWIDSVVHTFFVASGGTALSGSHKWVTTVRKLAVTTGTITTFATFNVDTGNSNEWRESTAANTNALMNNGTTHILLTLTHTKTGTPGNYYAYVNVLYRIVG